MPHISISPVLAEDVSWVCRTRDMRHVDNASSYSFTDTVVGQHSVPLVKLGVDLRGTVDYGLIIPKHIAPVTDRNS